jgi:glycosyltransferase involved in cell wall biosynthesis
MNKISACLILRNEEKNAKRCLDSLQGAVDEIIVVHDGKCIDETMRICKEYTNIIFERPFAGYMEAHLPFAFKQANGDWILRIDGDEFLSEELKKNLKQLVSSNEAEGYSFAWPIWDGKKVVASKGYQKLSLFKKDKTSFISIIHFIPVINGKIKTVDFIIHHRPDYNDFSFKIFIKKWIPRAHLDASTYFKKIETFNCAENRLPINLSARKYLAPILLFTILPIFLIKGLHKSLYDKNIFYLKVNVQFGVYRTLLELFILETWIKKIILKK